MRLALALVLIVLAVSLAGLVLQNSQAASNGESTERDTPVAPGQADSQPEATVYFFSNNSPGYACFMSYDSLDIGPYCVTDVPSLMLPNNATMPYGHYAVVFFPYKSASNQTLWYATNNIQITGSGPYDASSSFANVTINGNGAMVVIVLPET